MVDINQAMHYQGRLLLDPKGNLVGDPDWSEERAQELAKALGVSLSSEHWDVIRYLRDHYRQCGVPSSGTSLLRCMEDHFVARGGGKYLYRLFPGGPVTQGTRIAGLAPPPYSSDPSFGTVE
jgi:tRNA 2-thiouridine synthesizing protein E